MNPTELKNKNIKELVALAASLHIEGYSSMRKQELIFAILKSQADEDGKLRGSGVLDVLQDGFGFLRAPDYNYLPGPDDIYVSPSQIRRLNLRTGDTIEGEVRAPKENERYFALLQVDKVNFDDSEACNNKTLFVNLTPLHPDEQINLEDEPDNYSTSDEYGGAVRKRAARSDRGPAPDRENRSHAAYRPGHRQKS